MNAIMETVMMFGQVIHPPGALSQPKMTGGTKAVTDFSPYITLAAAFCKSVLISVYFCTTRKSISNLPPISLVLAGLPTPKRLMLFWMKNGRSKKVSTKALICSWAFR